MGKGRMQGQDAAIGSRAGASHYQKVALPSLGGNHLENTLMPGCGLGSEVLTLMRGSFEGWLYLDAHWPWAVSSGIHKKDQSAQEPARILTPSLPRLCFISSILEGKAGRVWVSLPCGDLDQGHNLGEPCPQPPVHSPTVSREPLRPQLQLPSWCF